MTHQPHLTYIGHATTLIELAGARLLTDPVLRRRVAHLHHRHGPTVPARYQNIDAVLISHLHYDHLDLPSLRLLDQTTRLIVPRGAAKLLRGFRHVEELGVGQTTQVGRVTVRATYANHTGERHRFGYQAECVGYLISSGCTIYFAGDTDLFPEMAELAEALDVALLPVWGWGPTLGKGHLTPERAAEALTLLRPRLAVPIHWGTLHPLGMGWLKPRFLIDPPHAFARRAAQLVPEVTTRIITPGHSLALGEVLGEGE